MATLKTWLRLHKKEVLFGAAIFLASSLSFALGYLANREYDHAPIIIQACSALKDAVRATKNPP